MTKQEKFDKMKELIRLKEVQLITGVDTQDLINELLTDLFLTESNEDYLKKLLESTLT